MDVSDDLIRTATIRLQGRMGDVFDELSDIEQMRCVAAEVDRLMEEIQSDRDETFMRRGE